MMTTDKKDLRHWANANAPARPPLGPNVANIFPQPAASQTTTSQSTAHVEKSTKPKK
jgi:hypothetical protein